MREGTATVQATTSASHSADAVGSIQFDSSYSMAGLYLWFVIASLPALAVALALTTGDTNPGGAGSFALLLLVSVSTSYLWHLLFARVRQCDIDPAWFMHAWLFCLLVPASMSLPLAVLGVSFGVVVGSLIFGGSGRYVVSPALLGVLLVALSYPGTFEAASGQSTWAQLVGSPGDIDLRWLEVFGFQSGVGAGTVSAAACAFGAVVLWFVGAISARIVVGGLIGIAVASALLSLTASNATISLPYYWHWILGSLPFCLAFVVTDPTTSAVTNAGRWLYGGLFGALVVVLRVVDPDHPEGTLAAVLLASLFVPLIDYCCVRVTLMRWQRRKRRAKR